MISCELLRAVAWCSQVLVHIAIKGIKVYNYTKL